MVEEADGFLAGAVGANLDEGPGLVATQTLMFAGIEGPAAMVQRLGDVWAGASYYQLTWAGLAAHGR